MVAARSPAVTQPEWFSGMIKKLLLKLNSNYKNREDGQLLISVLVMTLFLTALGLAIIGLSTTEFQTTHFELYSQNAELTAEAGIEQTVDELNQNSSFNGYPTATVFFDNANQGYGVFTTSISSLSGNSSAKQIISIGKVYNYNNQSELLSSYGVVVTVVGTASPGYSVISGPGGLIMSGSAAITNSTLYLSGYLDMSGRASVGTSSVPATVYVGDVWCPQGSNPGDTYPTTCPSSVQPITLGNSTYIYGSVCALNQTSSGPQGNEIQPGNGGKGLEVGCIPPTVTTPTYNWQAQEADVTTTVSGTSGQYACSGSGSITIPPNTELTGSSITWGNSCNYDITGNVYIPGNLTIDGAAQVTIDNSNGTTQPVILVGGTITVNGSASILENSDKTGGNFISIDSNASCGSDCTSGITGTALYNTQSFQTVDVAGAAKVPGSVFDAYWGEATLGGSGTIGGAAGQTINLDGAGTITFGTELDSGTSTWTISSYEPYRN
jgi:Tfp pilus assembly protein PilX